jgi:hypothetical protein
LGWDLSAATCSDAPVSQKKKHRVTTTEHFADKRFELTTRRKKMNIHINKNHLITFVCVTVVLILGAFVGYPKYQEQKSQKMYEKFLEIPAS